MFLASNVRGNYRRFIFSIIILAFFPFIGVFYSYSQSDGSNEDLLISSIRSGDLVTVCRLLDKSKVNEVTKMVSFTPLVLALNANQPEIVKYLLNNKADPNMRCKGKTP